MPDPTPSNDAPEQSDPSRVHVHAREASPTLPPLRPQPDSAPGAGHNSNVLAAEVLFRAAQRLETLDGEIAKLNGQKSDVFRELKVKGFDIAILRRVLRDSRIDPLVRKERDTTHALYLQALEVEKAKS